MAREVDHGGRYRPTGRVRVVDDLDPCPNRARMVVTVTDLDRAGSPNESGTGGARRELGVDRDRVQEPR